ncbi:histidinol-phosphate transaminase [Vulgatibacter incomptus]|uniref:Histidinol-phosphate aminotransferase n=1 Tax=Vulgatibacter incomptus TaxID=1391653 RepID=A0A0K1PDF8_9BACT|nr:histidinol-phosphate transaminase [Vulgatibacter incomptus]AKU91537.1 Histidinol-phosphate aminotransferase [Vulgatibacter incomptus]
MSLVPSFISSLSPYVPGKPIEETEREYGIKNAVKLASNENPLGPSPKAMEAIARALPKMHLYPDGASFYFKNRLADFLKVTPAELMLGNGSNELIEFLIRTFVHGDDELLISAGTFVVYKISAQAVGRKFVEVPMKERHYDLEAMAAAVTPKTRLVFIANPDNPTGSYQTEAALVRFLESVGEKVLVVMDEAYFEYVQAADYPNTMALRARFPNLIILRTFSKAYGLAGMRLGYGIARPELVDFVNRVRAPFNVSVIAQAGGIAALDDQEHVRRTVELNRKGLDQLTAELPGLGLSLTPSQSNFMLVDFHRPAMPLFEALLREGVITRPMGGYGFHSSLRINTGTEQDHEKLLGALKKVLSA